LINFHKLDINSIKLNSFIYIVGKRGCGKTYLIRDILNTLITNFTNDNLLIVSGTEQMDSFYSTLYPNIDVLYKCEHINENFFIKSDKPKCLVIDNAIYSKNSSDYIEQICIKCKANNILLIITCQFAMSHTPKIRSSFDYIFLTNDDFYSNQKRLYNFYGGVFPSFELFRTNFSAVTQDYGKMVICNKNCQGHILDKVFVY
jgi:Cdc6-like AAA superfamily ATPase